MSALAPGALRALQRRDPALAAAMRRLPPFPGFPDAEQQAAMPTHWDALARAIVFQQLATAAARTIHGRVCALAGGSFPSPSELLAHRDPTLRSAGLSANKIAALRDLAARVEDGRLRLAGIEERDDETVIADLVAVRSIGEWSAHMFLLFRLGRLDVGAAGDLGVREGLRLLDGVSERPSPKEALARMECWRPLRSVGCWLMWRLVEAERKAAAAIDAPARKPKVAASKVGRDRAPRRTPAKRTAARPAPTKRTPAGRKTIPRPRSA